MLETFQKNRFLFEELVKRDFKKKYKRTLLGIGWSVLSPLFMLFVMYMIFSHFFGESTEHYLVYLYTGQVVFQYFSTATDCGMYALVMNDSIIDKINVNKYLFSLSENVKTLINFLATLIVFFLVVAIDGIQFHFYFILLVYPIVCLFLFNVGASYILSALFVKFKDMAYLYSIVLQMIMFCSALFYTTDILSPLMQKMLLLNPVFVYILYFRTIIIAQQIPGLLIHALCLIYGIVFLLIGIYIYKKNYYKFIYYL